jgi:methionine biosynthesis protein MetW
MKINQSKRADFQIISEWIGQNTKVLDLGCGDGSLLNFLKTNNNVQGFGIEKDEKNWLLSLKNNIDVIQMDLEAGLSGFENNSFDTVILSKTLQAMHNIEEIMQEMLRVGNEVIITFPNFGYWKDRLQVMLGNMPISDELPYQWYNTPNIHLCTLSDFDQFCHKHKMKVLDRLVLTNNKPISVLPNLFGALALYRLIKK